MKRYLWIIGLVIVIAGSVGYAFSDGDVNGKIWLASTVAEVVGGLVLFASFLSYHTLSGKKR